MTRAAGTQAITYDDHAQGVSNSSLRRARQVIAKAAAAGKGGKNVDLTLLVLDGDSSTLDPAFEGNCAPIRQCATVWWENWVPVRSLNKAYVAAQNTIGKQDTPK